MQVFRVQARKDGALKHSRLFKQEPSAVARADRWRAQGYEVVIDTGDVELAPLAMAVGE